MVGTGANQGRDDLDDEPARGTPGGLEEDIARFDAGRSDHRPHRHELSNVVGGFRRLDGGRLGHQRSEPSAVAIDRAARADEEQEQRRSDPLPLRRSPHRSILTTRLLGASTETRDGPGARSRSPAPS